MEYLFLPRPGDREIILELYAQFKDLSKNDLIALYNRHVKIGVIGAQEQARTLIALYNTFNRTFGSSPIYIEGNCIVGLRGIVELADEKWVYKS